MKRYLILLLLCALGLAQPTGIISVVENLQGSFVEIEEKKVELTTSAPKISVRSEQQFPGFPDPKHLVPQGEPTPLLRPPTV